MKIEKPITPLMQQYQDIKEQYPLMLLLFQVGDFYELFFEDAQKASAYLGIALTKRGTHKGEPIPLCGVPVHAIDHYIQKLIKGGFCVVICDQLEPATPGKMVRRGVTQVLTPGTLTDAKMLDDKSASYLCSLVPYADKWGLVFAEMLTLNWYATTIPAGALTLLETELFRFFPDEIILDLELLESVDELHVIKNYLKKNNYFVSNAHGEIDQTLLEKKFNEVVVAQLRADHALNSAVSLLYSYLKSHNNPAVDAAVQMHFYQTDDFLVIDSSSQKNLELVHNAQNGLRENTLLQVLDKSVTSMGSRTLKKWLVRPLLSKTMIENRLEVVHFLKNNYRIAQNLRSLLSLIGDGERVVGRITLHRAKLFDYQHLKRIITTVPVIKDLFVGQAVPSFLEVLINGLGEFSILKDLLDRALYSGDEHDWIINAHYNQKLDELRLLVGDTQSALMLLEQQEQQATGINSLKIRYTAAHGYYIEITNTHANLVPAHYKRNQTLVGRERFTCSSLQELQHKILMASSDIKELEQDLYSQLKMAIMGYLPLLRKAMYMLAQLDALGSFALCAAENGYNRPVFHELNSVRDIIIMQGKHPVVEQSVGSAFVANNIILTEEQRCWIITGPNMGGKSTFLRQAALIQIMAQCGSFVPAFFVKLPLVDRIFTRIGASDNVAQGKSTFLVEMEETAHICQYATDKSLVILDEVGRGTSTFDGLALAQSVVEYIFIHLKAHCLFATHYHELSALQGTFSGIVNYHAVTLQEQDRMVFLHKIMPGVAQGSFGLEVAKLAHIPDVVIKRAAEILALLVHEKNDYQKNNKGSITKVSEPYDIEKDDLRKNIEEFNKIKNVLNSISYDDLSPKQALDILWQLRTI